MRAFLVIFFGGAVLGCSARLDARIIVQNLPIRHQQVVFSAYEADAGMQTFQGLRGLGGKTVLAAPGVLALDPGDDPVTGAVDWRNFVTGFNRRAVRPNGTVIEPDSGLPILVKNVLLRKTSPKLFQCGDVFRERKVAQQGPDGVRLWWPLMYEPPGTTFTVTITWATREPLNFPSAFPGDSGETPGSYSYVHQDVWVWTLDADEYSMEDLLYLFHTLPLGLDEVPLISDEVLLNGAPAEPFVDLTGDGEWNFGEPYTDKNRNGVWDEGSPGLLDNLHKIQALVAEGRFDEALDALAEFEMWVNDACIGESPVVPSPTGPGTGIAETTENPACCKILADAEYIILNKL